MKKKQCSRCGKTKRLKEFGARKSSRDGKQGWCLVCTRKYHKAYKAENQDRIREISKRERDEKPEQVKARQRRYRERHPDKIDEHRKPYEERREYYRQRYQKKKAEIRDRHKEYYRINRTKIAEYHKRRYLKNRAVRKVYKARWDRDNRDKCRAQWTARATRKRQAMPLWADVEKIKRIYAEAETMCRETGIEHHVDHIVPLRHPLVCGLHWHRNLQILTRAANQEKNNKFQPYFKQFGTGIMTNDIGPLP